MIKIFPPESPSFLFDKRREDCLLLENIPFEQETALGLMKIVNETDELFLSLDEILERYAHVRKAGQLHAERLFQCQEKIPKEWRKYILVFAGTIWKGGEENPFRYVCCLFWIEKEQKWKLDFFWSIYGFRKNSRLVCLL